MLADLPGRATAVEITPANWPPSTPSAGDNSGVMGTASEPMPRAALLAEMSKSASDRPVFSNFAVTSLAVRPNWSKIWGFERTA